mgnify:CR=1 FL=1
MSRRNNNERLGAPHPDAPAPPPTHEIDNETFSFVTPTDFVELPSAGRFYAEDHPLHNETTIEIKHMTAKEEDILSSEALIKNGLAISRLLQSIIVNKRIDAASLLLGDRNAILVASRITGYGAHYGVNTRCPSCYAKEDHTFNLEEIGNSTGSLPEDVEDHDDGTFTFALPSSGVSVRVKMLTGADEKYLAKSAENMKKIKKEASPVTDLLKTVIVSVNTVTKPSMIHQFVDLMPLPDVRVLRETYESIKPDVDLKFHFTCTSCSYEGEVTMPLTAKFFWPNL